LSENDDVKEELNSIDNEKLKERLVQIKWKNRRRMAYTALFAMIMMTVCIFFIIKLARLDKIQDAITWGYIMFGSIVLAYLGAATWDGHK